MMKSDKKKSLAVQETGSQFYQPNDQSFSYEIEIEKEYVQRLKVQRQKIQALYTKYDILLTQMKKKDLHLRQKDDKLNTMTTRVKDLQLNVQQLAMVQQQYRQAVNENIQLKRQVAKLENQNGQMLEQMKLKDGLVYDERNQLDAVNQQLQDKVRGLTNKLLQAQEELRTSQQADRQKLQSLKSQHNVQVTALSNQIIMLKNQIIKRDQTIHMQRLESEFMQQKLQDQEDTYASYMKQLETKIEKNQREKRLQIQGLKTTLQEKVQHITSLDSKILAYKAQLQAKELQLEQSKKVVRDEKKLFDDDVFQLKTQMNNEKLYFKEQLMYCQNHIEKLEKKLSESLKREKDLGERIKKYQLNESAKRNLREIERQQIEKINKILAYQ